MVLSREFQARFLQIVVVTSEWKLYIETWGSELLRVRVSKNLLFIPQAAGPAKECAEGTIQNDQNPALDREVGRLGCMPRGALARTLSSTVLVREQSLWKRSSDECRYLA